MCEIHFFFAHDLIINFGKKNVFSKKLLTVFNETIHKENNKVFSPQLLEIKKRNHLKTKKTFLLFRKLNSPFTYIIRHIFDIK